MNFQKIFFLDKFFHVQMKLRKMASDWQYLLPFNQEKWKSEI